MSRAGVLNLISHEVLPREMSHSLSQVCEGHFWFPNLLALLPLSSHCGWWGVMRGGWHTPAPPCLQGDGCPFKGNPGVETLNSVS